MKTLLHEFKASLISTLILAVVCCGAYPVVVWACSQALFPGQANGSLLKDGSGQIIGSALIGQSFTSPKYFHSRPSAAGTGYDPTNSGGTNLGPTSKKLSDSIAAAVAAYRAENSLGAEVPVPADAVTSSASGVDPDISVANAGLQVLRVAKARGLVEADVRALVEANTQGRDWGVFGEPRVNVLKLNLALDRLQNK